MRLNRTSLWQVMTILISLEHSLFNFERLDILCAWIGLQCDKLWPFEFLESFRCSISSVSVYFAPESDVVWQVMTIWISRELPLFNSELPDILSAGIGPPCDKLWPFQYLESFRCSISSVSVYYAPESDFVWQVMTIWISRELLLFNFERLHIWCAWIGFPCASYDHLNFSRAFVVQFRASRYTIRRNRTSVW